MTNRPLVRIVRDRRPNRGRMLSEPPGRDAWRDRVGVRRISGAGDNRVCGEREEY